MKKYLSIVLSALMLVLALTSCQSWAPQTAPYNTEPVKTEAADPAELGFDTCAEEIASIPVGESETDAHYPPNDTDEYGPYNFWIAEEKLYAADLMGADRSLLVMDIPSGQLSRLHSDIPYFSALYDMYRPFCVKEGLIISNRCAFEAETGLMTELHPPIPLEKEYASLQVMYTIGDDVFLSYDISEKADSRMVCRFDRQKMEWSEPELLFNTPEGTAYYSGDFKGCDAEGNRYFTPHDPKAEKDGHIRRVIEKYGPDDRLLARLPLPWFEDDLYKTGESSIRVTEDGTVYIMAPFTDALRFYKVNMG